MGIYIEKRKSTIGGTELCCSSPNGVSHTLGNRGFAAFILQDEPGRFSCGISYKKTIYVADFTSASDEIKKITIDNNILGDDLFVRNDGKIIYTGNVTGNTSGTYMYDPDKKTSILISENEMDVHQIYNITAL